MKIDQLDHFVLTVKCIETTCAFYQDALGMEIVTFGEGRKALKFGAQKINLHEYGNEFEPKARQPQPGSADFCMLTSTPLEEVLLHFSKLGVQVETEIVARTGANGPIRSVYLRDPDGNLLEVSNQLEA